ncbi:MAG: thiamine-phosphate kinase [Stellaceae bacterium]
MGKPPPLDEFQRIARYFAPLAGPGALGLKDDIALIDGPVGTQYVLKTDAIVEGIHFFRADPPHQIAQKLLRVNLSDLAAKGAVPLGYLLVMALPPTRDEAWLEAFSAGLAEDQRRYHLALLGGDSVRIDGPTTLSMTAIGQVDAGAAPLRSGARVGDTIYVSGTLGDAAIGLRVLKGGLAGLTANHRRHLTGRYRLPEPRLELGRQLIGIASAAMDISDGLVADLGHLCDASGVAAEIEAARLPLSPAAREAVVTDPALILAALAGGDDYEILFAAPATAAARLGVLPVTPIGRISAGAGVTVRAADGGIMTIAAGGYRHI